MKKMAIVISVIVALLLTVVVFVIISFSKVEKVESLKTLSFSYTNGSSYLSDVSYTMECEDECHVFIKPMGVKDEDAEEVAVDSLSYKKIIDVLNEYQVVKWNGFHGTNMNVLDGDSFTFSFTGNDDLQVSASGYMNYPKNYYEVSSQLEDIFLKLK